MDYALWHATKIGDPDTVARLLAMNADFTARDGEGKTILHCAADWGKTAVVYLLVKKGAQVNAVDQSYKTPLHQAAFWGHSDVIRILLRAGAKVNAQDINGYTPLHYAASMSNVEAVHVLLGHGADPLLIARDGKDVYSLASSSQRSLETSIFKMAPADWNASNASWEYLAASLPGPAATHFMVADAVLHGPGLGKGGWASLFAVVGMATSSSSTVDIFETPEGHL